MSYRRYEPGQIVFIQYDPHVMYPEGSYERSLVDLLARINIENFWGRESQPKRGKVPYHPCAMLGIIFYGITKGVFSSRKLEEMCTRDMGFMYVSGHSTPDHATIARFISEHIEAIADVFVQVLYILQAQGHLDYDMIAIDGSKIKANASNRFSGKVADFKKRKKKLDENINLALEKLQDSQDAETSEYWKKKKTAYEKDQEKISEFLEAVEPQFTKKNKEMKQNITDPDSRVMKAGQKYLFAYNAQVVANDKGIIVGADVVNDSNDDKMLKHMLETTKAQSPEAKKEEVKKGKVLCDNGYVTQDSVAYAAEENIDTYMPVSCDKKLYEQEQDEDETITLKDCELWEDDENVYCKCPGEVVVERKKVKDQKSYTFTFANIDKCTSCKYKDRCQKNKEKPKSYNVKYKRIINDRHLKHQKEKMRTEESRRIYSQRINLVEKIFGHMKWNWGFASFFRRGQEKVRVEWILLCIAYNIKKSFRLNYI